MFTKLTALVIDDCPVVSAFLHSILTQDLKFGSVLLAKNGEEGLLTFKRNQVDWVFSDIEMPLMTGFDVLARVRELPNGKEIPFFILTSYVSKQNVSEAFIMGATEFVSKPLNGQKIAEKVRRVATMPKPLVRKAALTRRRRVSLKGRARISFSPRLGYTGEIINVSLSGCLIRAPLFSQGGMVYDEVRLSMDDAKGDVFILKALLIRLEIDEKQTDTEERFLIAAFQFTDLTDAARKSLKQLLIQSAVPALGANG